MNQRASAFLAQLKANRPAYTLSILLTLTLGILIGTVISYGVKGQDKKSTSSDAATPLTVPSPQMLSSQFSQISKQLEPSVVNINTESTIKAPKRRRGGPNDDEGNPFDDFFDRFFGGQGGQGGQGGSGGAGSIRERSLGFGRYCGLQGLHRHQPPCGGEGRPHSGQIAG